MAGSGHGLPVGDGCVGWKKKKERRGTQSAERGRGRGGGKREANDTNATRRGSEWWRAALLEDTSQLPGGKGGIKKKKRRAEKGRSAGGRDSIHGSCWLVGVLHLRVFSFWGLNKPPAFSSSFSLQFPIGFNSLWSISMDLDTRSHLAIQSHVNNCFSHGIGSQNH